MHDEYEVVGVEHPRQAAERGVEVDGLELFVEDLTDRVAHLGSALHDLRHDVTQGHHALDIPEKNMIIRNFFFFFFFFFFIETTSQT